MIILDQTSYALLAYLIKLTEPKTVMEISKQLTQSRRKIYYHLEKINDALPKNVESISNYPHIGILLNDYQKNACIHLLKELETQQYIMNVEERKQLIILYISISSDYITIEKLMKLTDVSRNTVLNDLNSIREDLTQEQYNIQLHVTKSQGYYLDAHPLSKIQFIYKILYEINTEAPEIFKETVHNKMAPFTDFENYFSNQQLEYLKYLLIQYRHELGKRLNDKDCNFMLQILPYVLLSYRNIKATDYNPELIKQDFLLVQERIEYKVADKILQALGKKFNVAYDDLDKNIIAVLLLSFRKDSDNHNHSPDYDDMRETLRLFLNRFEEIFHINFYDYDNLLNQLLTHCKALLYRKTYGISSINPLKSEIIQKYNRLFTVTKCCVPLLEEHWLIHLNDDDIAYIAIHLGGYLHTQSTTNSYPKIITLVCDESISIRKFFLKQCQNYISKTYIETVFTIEQFHSIKDLLNSDVIISTSDTINTDVPLLVVNPILTDNDVIRLISFLYSNNEQIPYDFTLKLDKLLKHYIKNDSELYTVRSQIEKIFSNELLHYLDK